MKLRNGFVSNSSSSCFVCNTDMTVEQVKDKLADLLEVHNEYTSDCLQFDNVFLDPFIADKNFCEEDWRSDYGLGNAEGKILIVSTSDNSIPYEMFDYIESKFDARRIHCG